MAMSDYLYRSAYATMNDWLNLIGHFVSIKMVNNKKLTGEIVAVSIKDCEELALTDTKKIYIVSFEDISEIHIKNKSFHQKNFSFNKIDLEKCTVLQFNTD
ncbi:hypothetical protein A3Q56_05134 [Intoshia linei]|uniref:LSM domain-containing protein n=1 Tax=Intoshia linei TaxID=1819745 RepID=A0A177B071_9BILA|nr:hypothetical protein A3Q56_05134 [Intoshia linei]